MKERKKRTWPQQYIYGIKYIYGGSISILLNVSNVIIDYCFYDSIISLANHQILVVVQDNLKKVFNWFRSEQPVNIVSETLPIFL